MQKNAERTVVPPIWMMDVAPARRGMKGDVMRTWRSSSTGTMTTLSLATVLAVTFFAFQVRAEYAERGAADYFGLLTFAISTPVAALLAIPSVYYIHQWNGSQVGRLIVGGGLVLDACFAVVMNTYTLMNWGNSGWVVADFAIAAVATSLAILDFASYERSSKEVAVLPFFSQADRGTPTGGGLQLLGRF